MARSFGNTGASNLIRASEAALNKVNTYNDAEASYEFDLSAKTAQDYQKFSDYLSKRVTATRNTDPSKALSLQRTITSANRTFNSAEISRASTAVKYGDMSNRDKYGQMAKLWQAASANGDDNLAQSLEGQLASLSVTIQNEDTANANAARTANDKVLAANKRGIDQTASKFDTWMKLAKDQVSSGKISAQDYEAGVAQALQGKKQLLEDAASGKYGDITPEAQDAYGSKSTDLAASDQYRNAVARYPQAAAGSPTQYLQINPTLKNQDGSYAGTLKDRPGSRVELDAAGNPKQVYSGGFQDYNQTVDPKTGMAVNTPTGDIKSRQAFLNSGKDYVFNQVSRDPTTGRVITTPTPVGGAPIKDAKGNYFVVDQNGAKHYVNPDPNATLQRSSTPIGDMPDFGQTSTIGQIGQSAVESPLGKIANATSNLVGKAYNAGTFGLFNRASGLINSIVNRNDQAQAAIAQKALQDRVAAQNAAKDAASLAASRKLLPVFRPPAPVAPPKVTAKPSQYNLPALPAPVKLPGSNVTVPASTGNYQKDVLNLGRSLGGLL
jgi:hypothetical protein